MFTSDERLPHQSVFHASGALPRCAPAGPASPPNTRCHPGTRRRSVHCCTLPDTASLLALPVAGQKADPPSAGARLAANRGGVHGGRASRTRLYKRARDASTAPFEPVFLHPFSKDTHAFTLL